MHNSWPFNSDELEVGNYFHIMSELANWWSIKVSPHQRLDGELLKSLLKTEQMVTVKWGQWGKNWKKFQIQTADLAAVRTVIEKTNNRPATMTTNKAEVC